MIRVRAGVLLLVVLGLAVPAAAQRTTGEIIGNVPMSRERAARCDRHARAPAWPARRPSSQRRRAPTVSRSCRRELTRSNLRSAVLDVKRRIPVAVGSTVELEIDEGRRAGAITVSGEAPVVNIARRGQHDLQPRVGENAPVRRFSYFDSGQLRAGRQRDLQRRTGTAAQSLGNSTNENRTRSTAPRSARLPGSTPTRWRRSKCCSSGRRPSTATSRAPSSTS